MLVSYFKTEKMQCVRIAVTLQAVRKSVLKTTKKKSTKYSWIMFTLKEEL